jgi:Sec-independent protein translocase protein TatA
MMGFGFSELIFIAIVALLVIKPQDLPRLAYQFGKIMRQIRHIHYSLSMRMDHFMQEQDAAAQTKDPYAPSAPPVMTPLPVIEQTSPAPKKEAKKQSKSQIKDDRF